MFLKFYKSSMNFLLFQLDDILLGHIESLEFLYFLLFKFLQQPRLFFMLFLGLLVLDFSQLFVLFLLLRFWDDLFFEFQGVLFEQLLSFLLKLFLKFTDLLLLTDGWLEFCLFSSGLLLEHFLFLKLLLMSGMLQLWAFFRSYFGLLSLFLPGCSFISLDGSFGS